MLRLRADGRALPAGCPCIVQTAGGDGGGGAFPGGAATAGARPRGVPPSATARHGGRRRGYPSRHAQRPRQQRQRPRRRRHSGRVGRDRGPRARQTLSRMRDDDRGGNAAAAVALAAVAASSVVAAVAGLAATTAAAAAAWRVTHPIPQAQSQSCRASASGTATSGERGTHGGRGQRRRWQGGVAAHLRRRWGRPRRRRSGQRRWRRWLRLCRAPFSVRPRRLARCVPPILLYFFFLDMWCTTNTYPPLWSRPLWRAAVQPT